MSNKVTGISGDANKDRYHRKKKEEQFDKNHKKSKKNIVDRQDSVSLNSRLKENPSIGYFNIDPTLLRKNK
jgi:hypothetical protein